MKFLIFTKINGGYKIKDSVTDCEVSYFGYTKRQAEQKHRKNFNLKNQHFEKIFN